MYPRITALTGNVLPKPQWHILRVMSGQEAKQADRLALAGIEPRYPTKLKVHRDAQGKRRETVRAEVPGIILAKFKAAPMWHEMRARRIITGVFCRETQFGMVPYQATENDVRQFMGIPTVEDELEAARREALRVRPGDRALVLFGDDAEMAVTITEVSGGRAFWEAGAIKGSTAEDRCEKVA